MKLYSIWDIDNCLADDHWRQQYIDWDLQGDERYRRYNALSHRDTLHHRAEFELMLKIGAEPVFFSGRPEYMREMTWVWLRGHLTVSGLKPQPTMYLRENGTVGLTPKACKETMLKRFFAEHLGFGNRIIGAFDDIPAIVAMYRENNIPAAQLCIHHDLSGAYQPSDLK